MLMEPRHLIEARQFAARKWLDAFAERKLQCKEGTKNPQVDALIVIVLTQRTSDFLAEHDPQALKQAQKALDGTSWEDYK